jgi:hypothetical protein
MNGLADAHRVVLYELETVRPDLHAIREQDRRAWWIAAASASRDAKESRIRRVAVQLGDLLAGLRCQLEGRLASESAAPAC